MEARAFQRALEGDLEPVYYMGVVVDYVRKFDSRLQIELLRAKRPESFKTPGMNVNVGVKSDVFVLTEEQRHILMDYNRQWLLDHPPPTEEPGEPPRELGEDGTCARVRNTAPATYGEISPADERDSSP